LNTAVKQLALKRRESRDRTRFDDIRLLSARQGAKCRSQTTYLKLAEMTEPSINPSGRSKRDDRLCEGLARVATAAQMLQS
jgi:hypothetical protein